MRFLFSFLTELFIEERSNEGLISALRRLGGATAAFRHMAMHRHLFDLPIYRRYVVGAHDDPLFHLSHRHYLSKRFGCRKRVECVVSHYRYEGEFYNRRYQDAVYRDGGLTVWSKAIDDLVYSIRLQPTTDARQEGGTGVVAYAGDTALSELSFVWIDGSVLGLERGILPFVTKNQSVRHNNAALQPPNAFQNSEYALRKLAVNRHRAAPLALAPITIRILALSVAQLLGVEAFELA